ncbi:MAG: citrate/2-methylcitrate synthase [Planctomycetota bacterium]|jgi:citrate synthase
MVRRKTKEITDILIKAAEKARKETKNEPEPWVGSKEEWPLDTTIGPGLEGAIACYTNIGHVNGSKGVLTYGGYNVFDLAISSTFEETAYLLIFGKLPSEKQLAAFNNKLVKYRHIPQTLRLLQSFPVEEISPMGSLRLGVNLMRRILSKKEQDITKRDKINTIGTDEDSIPEETTPAGHEHAVFEVENEKDAENLEDIYHLISGMATLTAAISRIRDGHLPIEPDPELGHSANFLYMMTGKKPTAEEERIMDISLIIHADHGMNASTFASMVVASTLSDIYFSIGAGVAALNGPLHGGANEQVLYMLEDIAKKGDVIEWYEKARAKKQKIMGMGHRVYKTYDPRARILGPMADFVAKNSKEDKKLLKIARTLEKEVVNTLGSKKGIFPNVDFYSGIVYRSMGLSTDMFTPIFAVSRVAGWAARVREYLRANRIFRPRAIYTGDFEKEYVAPTKRGTKKKSAKKKK